MRRDKLNYLTSRHIYTQTPSPNETENKSPIQRLFTYIVIETLPKSFK